MILVLTDADAHADRVALKLEERGAAVARFNPAEFAASASLSLAFSPGGGFKATLGRKNGAIDLTQLQSVWYRRPQLPAAPLEITDQAVRDYVEEERKIYLEDAWNALDCLWMPGVPSVVRRAELKASQLKLAGELGFELPPTLFTNDPAEFLEFYNQHNGNIISKLAGVAFFHTLGPKFCRYTEVVSKRDIGYLNSISYCPVIFQAYVSKRVELRITVVGERALAAEIHSQQTNHTRHDWRRYDRAHTPYLPHALPVAVEQLCVRLVKRLGLCFGAIDMVLTPDGRYVFLEINPNGQYLWVEDATGLPISDAICDLLMAGAPAGLTASPTRPAAPALGGWR